jgi:hypothetical protein
MNCSNESRTRLTLVMIEHFGRFQTRAPEHFTRNLYDKGRLPVEL